MSLCNDAQPEAQTRKQTVKRIVVEQVDQRMEDMVWGRLQSNVSRGK
jgi:hypothetical protein